MLKKKVGSFMEKYREIEKSIIKKYRKEIWSKFVKAIKEYELIKENDKIAVCISGGKDSFLLAKCLEELQRHGIFKFHLEFIIMNPGYKEDVLKQIQNNLETLNIEAHIFEAPIFSYTDTIKNPCYLCAKMRRGYLYNYAKTLGCNKIALGHHFNDVVETILLNMIYSGKYASMMPKLKSTNYHGMELIRSLYLVKEEDIKSWAKYNDLKFIGCACKVTKKDIGQRQRIKQLVKHLKEYNKDADKCIFTSSSNVNLNTIIKYQKDKEVHSFLDDY